MKGKTLIVLLGPTGIGKTELCLTLAQRLDIPVINADSRQIYKGMDIGTAAPTLSQTRQVRHYFVRELNPEQYYSAARYETDVLALLEKLFQNSDTALMCGGSMLYLDAVCQGIDDIPTVDEETRQRLKTRMATEGIEPLREELRLVDPVCYNRTDLKNPRRVIHALEIYYCTGKPYSSFLRKEKKPRPFNILKIGLERSREELFGRINRRVDGMMEQGLMEEARKLYPLRHLNALQTVGYRELFPVIEGNASLEFATEKIKRNTRVYAKKQITWFKRDPSIQWFHPSQTEEIWNAIRLSVESRTSPQPLK